MYLIKIELDRGHPEARKILTDCQQMHCFVTKLLGTDRQNSQVLYRTNMVEKQLNIYLYSQKQVDVVPAFCNVQQRDVTNWLDSMEAGQIWNFDLIASPSKKVAVDGRKNSQRRIIREPGQRQAWLERKADQSGFAIVQAQELEQIHISGKHSTHKGGDMYHDAYHYRGVLQITDAEQFRYALQNGIGSGKAYGFGMIMVKKG